MATLVPDITAILRGILQDVDPDVTAQTRFEDLGGWDSMDLVTVVVEAECRFNVQFELPEIDRLVTVGDLASMIEAKRALASV